MAVRLYAGTSGFSFPEWKGGFYPAGLPASGMLAFYSRVFPTVEINNSFYRYPSVQTLAQWARTVPEGFLFSVKAHRRITHDKRLRDVDADVGFLLERIRALGDRLGPVLFQLPPSLRCDLPLLEAFLATLRPGIRAAIEFRHASWRREEVRNLLHAHGVILVIAEADDQPPHPHPVVGPGAYLRLHRSRYGDEDLARWSRWIRLRLDEGRPTWAYFTHEDGAPAPAYARRLAELVGPAGRMP